MKEEKVIKRLMIPFGYDKKIITKGDGRLYSNVTILNSGEFIDSISMIPSYYSEDALRSAAIRWTEKDKYHNLDSDMTYLDLDHKVYEVLARIGYVSNVHFSDSALRSDLFLHLLTQNSIDTKTLIDAGYINHLSVEITTQDRWDTDDDTLYAENINLLGVAVVTAGADPQALIK